MLANVQWVATRGALGRELSSSSPRSVLTALAFGQVSMLPLLPRSGSVSVSFDFTMLMS